MARSSILGSESAPQQAEGRDVDALGPSDTSDSGSDVAGGIVLDAADELGNLGQDVHRSRAGASDAGGTGERGSAVLGDDGVEASDILPDRIGRFDDMTTDERGAIDELVDDDQPDEIADDPVEPRKANPAARSR